MLVTGALGALGRHSALTLAAAGASVAVAGRNVTALEDVVEELYDAGCSCVASVALEVRDRDSVSGALNKLVASFGVPDIVVKNAGVSATTRALEFTDGDWNAMVGPNVAGAWVIARDTARCMISAGVRRPIINASSLRATQIAGCVSLHAVSKARLGMVTRALALEVTGAGIPVNSIAAGNVVTDLNRDFLAGDAGQKLTSRSPTRRCAQPEDLDGALLLLAPTPVVT